MQEKTMKYVILGAGGTGGILGFMMTSTGKDVSLVARGEHLSAMQEKGLTLVRQWCHTRQTIQVKACAADDCPVHPDVILVCVKSYSLESVIPVLQRIAGPETVVIPILNLFGTGKKLQQDLPGVPVLDGCIYVSGNLKSPGVLEQHGEILRVIFGVRTGEEIPESIRWKLAEIEKDFRESGIAGLCSDHIERDCLKKFSYVSPAGAAGLFYNATAGDFQKEGPQREMLKAMIEEITRLAEALGYGFDEDVVQKNLTIMSKLEKKADTSMQRDVAAGRPSEIDGLVFEVVRMGQQAGISLPTYEMAAKLLEKKYAAG